MKYLSIALLVGLLVVLSACATPQTLIREGASLSEIDESRAPSNEVPELEAEVVLAGTTATYSEFNQAAYEQALAEDKKIFLKFYANWCPSCKKEEKIAQEFFSTYEDDDVVGFRVNWKDSDTSDEEKALASEFGASTQSTKVYLVGGERVHKIPKHYSSLGEYEQNFEVYFG